MRCPQEELKGYLLGELPAAERRSVEGHLEGCQTCRDELEKLRLTTAALASLPDEEMPYKIAFVSDKIFEPKGWSWLWNSAPRLGFASALILAAAILVHAFAQPAAAPSAAQMAAMEARVRSEVIQGIEADLVPVVDMLQKRAMVMRHASLEDGGRP